MDELRDLLNEIPEDEEADEEAPPGNSSPRTSYSAPRGGGSVRWQCST